MLLHQRLASPDEAIDVTHDRLYQEFAPPPLPTLEVAARSIGARFEALDPDDDASFTMLEAVVASTWCAVVVMGGVWTQGVRRPGSKLKEPHGRLSSDSSSALPRHAVVVTAWDAQRISIHDPWFDVLDQPLRVEPRWLRRAWTGEYAYFLPPLTRS